MRKNKTIKIGAMAFLALTLGVLNVAKNNSESTFAVEQTSLEVGSVFKYSELYYEVTSTTKKEIKVVYDSSYTKLDEITFIGNQIHYYGTAYNIIEIGDGAFKDCTNLTYIWMLAPDFIIADNAFENINKNAAVVLNNNDYYDYYKNLEAFKNFDFCLRSDKSFKDIMPADFPSTYENGAENTNNNDVKIYYNANQGRLSFGQKNNQSEDVYLYTTNNIHTCKDGYFYWTCDGAFTGYIFINYEGDEFFNISVKGFTGNREMYNGVYGKPFTTLNNLIDYDKNNMPTSKDNCWLDYKNGPKFYFKDSMMYIDDTPIASLESTITKDIDNSYDSICRFKLEDETYIIDLETYDSKLSKVEISVPLEIDTYHVLGIFRRPVINNLDTYFDHCTDSDFNTFVNEKGNSFNNFKNDYNLEFNFWEIVDMPMSYSGGKYTIEKNNVKIEFFITDKVLTKIAVSGVTLNKDLNGEYKPMTRISKPERDYTEYKYNGNPQTYVIPESESYTVSNATQTEAGSYTVRVTLKNGYCWEDATTSPLTYTFNIKKGEGKIDLDSDEIVVSYGNEVTIPTPTSNFGTVTSDRQGTLSEIGEYLITYTLQATSNYTGDTKTLKIIINKTTIDEPVDKNGKKLTNSPVQIIDSEKGFNDNTKFVVDELNVNKQDDINKAKNILERLDKLSNDEKIFALYDVKLVDNGVETQPNGKITLKMRIPAELIDKNFKIYNIHTNDDGSAEVINVSTYEAKDGYAIFETNKLSQFAFISMVESNNPLPDTPEQSNSWVIGVAIGSSVVVVGAGTLLFFLLRKKKPL